MPKIGLVADGRFDEATITILLRRCGQGLIVEHRQCGGRNFSRAVGILREFERRRLVNSAIWATDAETDDGRQLESRMRKAVDEASLRLRVCCVPVIRMLEAWLLADEAAVQRVCGRSRRINNPEALVDPKTELRHILAPRPYTSAVAEQIAAEANVEVIATRCSSFQKLRDCIAEGSQPHRKSARMRRRVRTKARASKGPKGHARN